MKGIGKRVQNVEKALTFGQTEIFMSVNMLLIINVDLEPSIGKMGISMKECG